MFGTIIYSSEMCHYCLIEVVHLHVISSMIYPNFL
uniref:Uncharacterized protein n=1 Tax=Arundo donax TaxID=35708 RepID=A0A0A9FLU1_ARUDO